MTRLLVFFGLTIHLMQFYTDAYNSSITGRDIPTFLNKMIKYLWLGLV